jgi:hypothetical protein
LRDRFVFRKVYVLSPQDCYYDQDISPIFRAIGRSFLLSVSFLSTIVVTTASITAWLYALPLRPNFPHNTKRTKVKKERNCYISSLSTHVSFRHFYEGVLTNESSFIQLSDRCWSCSWMLLTLPWITDRKVHCLYICIYICVRVCVCVCVCVERLLFLKFYPMLTHYTGL